LTTSSKNNDIAQISISYFRLHLSFALVIPAYPGAFMNVRLQGDSRNPDAKDGVHAAWMPPFIGGITFYRMSGFLIVI